VLEFDIAAADVARLLRSPAITSRRQGRARTTKQRVVWHDTADAELQERGLALAEQGGQWRLERLVPNGSADWLPAAPAPVLAQAGSAEALGPELTGRLVPVAAFSFTQRSFPLSHGGGRLDVLQGDLRGVTADEPACRVVLAGPPADMSVLAGELAAQHALRVPRAGLGASAMALASGTEPLPRHTGGPRVPHGLNVDQALVLIMAHLTDVILHWSFAAPHGRTPEPVRQMRVAVRRLRSALSIFRRAAPGQELRALAPELKTLAALLGTARDWDVFLEGTGAEVQSAFNLDRRVQGLIAAAARKRLAAYEALSAYLGSDAWHRLTITLALLPTSKPWAAEAIEPDALALLQAPAEAFAAQALQRAFKQLRSAGDDLANLPPAALHDVRKQAKKLRYATEFFTPLFPPKAVRRFVDRLVDLQEALGSVNDAAVAATLMGHLAGGADRAFAAGAVQGYLAASTRPALKAAFKAWQKLCRSETFWH
jgi:triphosphatase